MPWLEWMNAFNDGTVIYSVSPNGYIWFTGSMNKLLVILIILQSEV